MKRTITLFIVLVLLLSVAACNSQSDLKSATVQTTATIQTTASVPETNHVELTKEELLAEAATITIAKIGEEYSNNTIRAKNNYIDGIYSLWGIVFGVADDCAVLKTDNSPYRVNAYLPMDELLALNKGVAIQVVGRITNIDGFIELSNAYMVTDVYEIKNAEVKGFGRHSTVGPMDYAQVFDDNFGTIDVYFDTPTLPSLTATWLATAKGKIVYGKMNNCEMKDGGLTIKKAS